MSTGAGSIELPLSGPDTGRGRGASRSARRAPGVLQVVGASVVVLGAWLPWLTMFAGLQIYRGTIGWNGRLILAAGIAMALGGAASAVSLAGMTVRRATGLAGALVAGAGVVLLARLMATSKDLAAHDAMMVARPGPGLFVVIAGALLVAAALAIPERS